MVYCGQIMKLKRFIFSVALSAFLAAPQEGDAGALPVSLPKTLHPLYVDSVNGFFWGGSPQLQRNAGIIPALLEDAADHGLNPQRYGLEKIREIQAKGNLSQKDRAQLDYALTYALWSYASDMAGRSLSDLEFEQIATARNLERAVESLAPDSDLYKALVDRLAEVDKLLLHEPANYNAQPISFGGKAFKAGDAHPDVPILRARLMKYGAGESFGNNPYTYDFILEQAVKNFQADHGLRADGIIGANTLEFLNRTLENERRQIVINMQRLRQPEYRARPQTRIDVDIARYWLTAYENGTPVMEMPVVVGSKRRQTMIFETTMTGVRINPGWTLPPTIKTEDYIPKLRENPEWVAEQGIKIYTDWSPDAVPVDPTLVDWSVLTDAQIKAMRMYKPAGATNPLGSYRFLMPNRYDIYLHDTNQKDLFGKAMRARSSGCVRVERPRELAEFLLQNDNGWTPEKINDVLLDGETYDIRAGREIPVYFDYKTAWIDENGELILGHDIYDFDNAVYRDIVKKDMATQKEVASFLNAISSDSVSQAESSYPEEVFPISLF